LACASRPQKANRPQQLANEANDDEMAVTGWLTGSPLEKVNK
jgi:hypothetical protein